MRKLELERLLIKTVAEAIGQPVPRNAVKARLRTTRPASRHVVTRRVHAEYRVAEHA